MANKGIMALEDSGNPLAHSTSPEVVHRFFDMLEEVFVAYELQDKFLTWMSQDSP